MLESIGAIVLIGMVCQWVSWRLKIPVVITLLLSGFAVGPLLGLIDPNKIFGQEFIHAIVELSVALILFDGAIKPAISYLIKMNCKKIILGCTELPIAIFAYKSFKKAKLSKIFMDPNLILAEASMRKYK